jgi:DNA modification methylase
VNGWADDYTPIFYWWNEEHKFYWKKWETDVIDDIEVTSVLESQKTLKNDLHPTMKPVVLLEKILNNSSKEGSKILDLFGWSGSTLIACEKKNRNCYMMELSPEYVQVIIKRFYDVTWGTVDIKCLNRDIDFTFLNDE